MRFEFKNNHAFTLAEVLITLGVIGIIAAMTLTALVTRYRFEAFDKQIKKNFSAVSRVLLTIGESEGDENLAYTYSVSLPGGGYKSHEHFYSYFPGKKRKWSTLYGGEIMSKTLFVLKDGSAIGFFASWNRLYVLIDANGNEAPNIIGYDAMLFEVKKNNVLSYPDPLWLADCSFPLNFSKVTDRNSQFCLPRYYLLDKCYNKKGKRYKDCLPPKK